MQPMGVLLVDKPVGRTSRRVVDRVQRCLQGAKAGHAGTLDPLAHGLLVVCVGPATRLISYAQRLPKCYQATFLLGRTSASLDLETDVALLDGAAPPARSELMDAARSLTGEIRQHPPAYSAIKIGGRRAYRLARGGHAVETPPRRVTVYALQITHYEYPELRLSIRCNSGTYVRSLGRDLARAAGTDAVMTSLVRTAIGTMCLDEAVPLDQLLPDTIHGNLHSPLRVLSSLGRVILTEPETYRIVRGQVIHRAAGEPGQEFAAVGPARQLVAIVRCLSDGSMRPVRNFARPK